MAESVQAGIDQGSELLMCIVLALLVGKTEIPVTIVSIAPQYKEHPSSGFYVTVVSKLTHVLCVY